VKTGDLVKIRATANLRAASVRRATDEDAPQIGIITDALEQSDGFYVLEVVSEGERGWYSDLDLELISEST